MDGDRLFNRACSDRTRGNGFKLNEGRFRLGIRKMHMAKSSGLWFGFFLVFLGFFYDEHGETLAQAAQRGGKCPSLETFKVRLDTALSNLV